MDFWSTERLGQQSTSEPGDCRLPHQHDFDRLLFSPPVRRLANKTQVFPLERDDAVRTRLTHSHEVVNLARSMGDRIVKLRPQAFENRSRTVRAMLSAIGLAHDLGNPPFGHQGEVAIGDWFRANDDVFESADTGTVPSNLRDEFLRFEGNAQTMRVVSPLGTLVRALRRLMMWDARPSARLRHFIEERVQEFSWEEIVFAEANAFHVRYLDEFSTSIQYQEAVLRNASFQKMGSDVGRQQKIPEFADLPRQTRVSPLAPQLKLSVVPQRRKASRKAVQKSLFD